MPNQGSAPQLRPRLLGYANAPEVSIEQSPTCATTTGKLVSSTSGHRHGGGYLSWDVGSASTSAM
jgi:hypothetical protein